MSRIAPNKKRRSIDRRCEEISVDRISDFFGQRRRGGRAAGILVAYQVGAQGAELDRQNVILAQRTLHGTDSGRGRGVKTFPHIMFVCDGDDTSLLGIQAELVGGFDHVARAGQGRDAGGGVETSGRQFGGVRLERVADFADATFLQ